MAKAVNLPVKRLATEMMETLIDDEKINKLASEYLSKHNETSNAAKDFIRDYSTQTNCIAIIEQVSSFTKIPEFTGATFGFMGLVYYQLYIVCGVAAIAGKDIHSNEVKTRCIECITANVITRGVRAVASKAAPVLLDKVKLKGTEKVVDAVVEFVLDWGTIKIVSNRAYKAFVGK